MSTLAYILVFSFIGSIGALIGGVVLLSRLKLALKISHFLASYAAGTLLGTAFLDLLPEAVNEAEHASKINGSGVEINVYFWTLAGLVLFFLVERFVHFFHHHGEFHEHESGNHHKRESRSVIPLIIIGDTLHNFIDGVVIAATFMVSIPLGITTTLAVALHEIPQEIGDFGLMLHKGMSRSKVIFVNILCAAAAMVGAVLTYMMGEMMEIYMPIFLATTAGFFIYIASSDLIPEIHHERRRGYAVIEILLLILGIFTVFAAVTYLEHGH